MMRVRNMATGKEVANSMVVAGTLLSRLKGLLGRKTFDSGEGMLIRPCKGIHTIGMAFPIDVLFLDRNDTVIACKRQMAPNCLTPLYRRAASVLELPAGTIDATSTAVGNRLEII